MRALEAAAEELAPRLGVFVALGAVLLLGAALISNPALALFFLLAGVTLLALAVLVKLLVARANFSEEARVAEVARVLCADPGACFVADPDGVLMYANPAAQERQGAILPDRLTDVLSQLFAAPASEIYRLQNRALAKGSASEDVFTQRAHLRLNVHPVGEGLFLWRLEDLGERDVEGRGGEAVPLPMMRISASGTVLYMNDRLRRLLGGRQTTLERIFPDLPMRPGEVQSVLTVDGPRRVLVVAEEGRDGQSDVYLLDVPQGQVVESAEWGVVESLPVPLVRLDRDGVICMANHRARDLLSADDAVGLRLSALIEGIGRPLADWLDAAWRGQGAVRPETGRASRNEDRFVQISLERYRDESGTSLLAIMADATEINALKDQFHQSQKMNAVGQLAGGVAHDFNNLLTAISGHCDLLLLRRDESDPDFADLSQIAQNTNRAASLVSKLLAFSRKAKLTPEALYLPDVVQDLIQMMNRLVGEKVSIELQVEEDLPDVIADKTLLEQALVNLVVNARDAMPSGGTVTISFGDNHLSTGLVRDRVAVPPGEYVCVQVADTGTGIKPESLKRIFDPFYTTKGVGRGTGLGLSMIYGFMKQSGGYVFVDSKLGHGTVFSLYFPVYHAGAAAALSENKGGSSDDNVSQSMETPAVKPTLDPPSALDPDLPPPCVLLVEDEAPVRVFASRVLNLKGYRVLEAESAEEALEILDREEAEVDLFISDIVLPEMDGPSWVEIALETRPEVNVIFMSGYAREAVAEQQSRIPNSVFLKKPFSLAELLEVVGEQLDDA
ncbi:MAG: hybrid sensor histidine kinase/response regulator [Rhodobacterales bacterium]|nr:MAG: hybrid sensor histidine kinase/response regulator [Rhodobacterales bacterium]